MGKVNFRTKLWAAAVVLSAFCSAGRVYAAAECSLLQILIADKEIVSYIECDSSIHAAQAQVAWYPCESVEIVPPEDISIHTVILLDNSLSISERNRKNIKNILEQYVQELKENEAVSLAVFGEDIQFLAEKSQNADEMLQLIDEIEFHNQNTYLTDYLFQVVEKIENDPEYTRFIVISDGVDNKAIGITKEELTSKLKETSRPIYTIGHIYKDNSAELKDMFALSRVTGGKDLLIEDFEDVHLIVDEIHDFSNIYSIKMDIPQDVMDGSSRHILLSIQTEDGDVEVTGEASMPFTLIEEEPRIESKATPEPTLAPTLEPTPEPVPEPTPEPAPEEKTSGIEMDKIIGAVVLVMAAAFLFYQKKKKSSHDKELKKNKHIMPVRPVPQEAIPKDKQDDEATMILNGRYLLVLRDRSNPERIFRYPIDGHVIVGRNIDMVQIAIDYNLTVSGQHCEFYIKNNRFFIHDMNSVNHTYLEGRMINGETEIISGNIIRLGEVELSVEIMPI